MSHVPFGLSTPTHSFVPEFPWAATVDQVWVRASKGSNTVSPLMEPTVWGEMGVDGILALADA